MIRIGIGYDLHHADDARFVAVGVIEKCKVAFVHIVAHEVTRLVVAYAIPVVRSIWHGLEIVNREGIRLRLHQPVLFGHNGNGHMRRGAGLSL